MGTDDFQDPAVALAELRARLEAGRVKLGLNQIQLTRRARLGRTTVRKALSKTAPAPTAQTVGALARALRLDLHPLLGLLAAATGPAAMPIRGPSSLDAGSVQGKPIADWDPHDLEVHPAVDLPPRPGHGSGSDDGSGHGWRAVLPRYVRRSHDEELADIVNAAARGQSRMAVLVGSSSTGKTRACWEAVQPLASSGWRLWHPFDPTRAEAALADLERVGPCTVVWLNEAQHYFGANSGLGERIAAALHALLIDPVREPVLVLGTLWREYATEYTALPDPRTEDPYPQVRELLAGRLITLPDNFDMAATAGAKAFAAAGDRQLAHALKHMGEGRLAQFLAGAPELLGRYETASPSARALLHVAMDARRLGVGLHLPLGFLEHAASVS
ncbi:hypothetical protein [Streptomyces mirabilis]|uniref:hypothetical protein n=1 Tax=Streptomyces mirabilis TaxID=68239 RepID=UPI0033B9BB89